MPRQYFRSLYVLPRCNAFPLHSLIIFNEQDFDLSELVRFSSTIWNGFEPESVTKYLYYKKHTQKNTKNVVI